MIILDVIQGSQEWLSARAGSLGASAIHEALAKTKSGWGASRANIKARLVAERLTGAPQDTFSNAAMQWGRDQEGNARNAYEFIHGVTVQEVGMVIDPDLPGTHASPDGLVGDDGLVEIKAPNTSTHIETLLGGPIADRYIKQMQWQMRMCNRQWCDFASYDPRLPDEMKLHVRRVMRDDDLIAEIEAAAVVFLDEIAATVTELENIYRKAE